MIARGGRGGKMSEGVQRYRFPVKVSHGTVRHSMVTAVNNTVLCIRKLLGE